MAEESTPVDKPAEDWMTTKWRPMMAVTYMAINICDFILFPIMFSLIQFWETEAANDAFRQWQPMTLQFGGLIHMAFGAILGISAWTRGQEKVAAINANSDDK
jgi:drug/metabolite transporter (DMT)-like permease